MRIISEKMLRDFWQRHSDAETPLCAWARHTKKARWLSFADVRLSFPHADMVGTCVVFNVGGHKYRLITVIHFEAARQKVYVRHVLTHREYDEGKWKDGCG
jgi:mRNA interferase HigB